MANEKRKEIWLNIADVRPLPIAVAPEQESRYREAENLVNSLWDKWMKSFAGKNTSTEVLALVAFRFAQLYCDEFAANKDVHAFLEQFEKELDGVVIDV
ncbi:MAG: cell division protein ZapA [Muribaculaceae bacterium]|nr:cell division protein ZapA [Muribaculaceae bacterium]